MIRLLRYNHMISTLLIKIRFMLIAMKIFLELIMGHSKDNFIKIVNMSQMIKLVSLQIKMEDKI